MSEKAPSAPSSPKGEKKKISPASLPPSPSKSHAPPVQQAPGGQDVLLFLIASRLVNALVIQTFFQPDEYFQALEPAWQWAFGPDAGAWITWEWKHHLRSAIHPAIFALAYRAAFAIGKALDLSPHIRAELFVVAPKTVQAFIAAAGDYYTWKLGEYVYGSTSIATAATLILAVASPWQWFCSTRTFSNSLETTLTIVALYNWPWHWTVSNDGKNSVQTDEEGLRIRDADKSSKGGVDEPTRLRRALLYAALATILRPTNVLIWAALTFLTLFRTYKSHRLVKMPWTGYPAILDFTAWTLIPSEAECRVFLREAVLCGGAMLSLSTVIDRFFYGTWAFPPLNFLHFNVVQSIAIFYGNNNWHYYLSQGYPLLLTTALPFSIVGLYNALTNSKSLEKIKPTSRNILHHLAIISVFVPTVLSVISHKEVRFIYPLLPALHILAALPVSNFFYPAFRQSAPHNHGSIMAKRLLLVLLLSLNLLISLYTTTIHNSGLVSINSYLRSEFETYYLPDSNGHNGRNTPRNLTAAFLMPCHSTPFRSHFLYPPTASAPGISAWALTCEPPLNLNATTRAAYVDEADAFYSDPAVWLKRFMSRNPPIRSDGTRHHEPGVFSHRPRRMFEVEEHEEEALWRERGGRKPWPEYLVFFEQLEPTMKRAVGPSGGYTECKRLFNSHWHDDWRRQGDVVVWCLYPERSDVEKERVQEVQRIERERREMAEDGRTVERAVVKPFWKQPQTLLGMRGAEEDEKWWQKIPGLRRKKRSWWQGGNFN